MPTETVSSVVASIGISPDRAASTGNVRRPVELLEVYIQDTFGSPDMRMVKAESQVSFQGKIYTPFPFERAAINSSTNQRVNGVEFTLPDASGYISAFCKDTSIEGSRVVLRRVYRPSLTRITSKSIFDGVIDNVVFADEGIKFTSVSILDSFDVELPRAVFGTKCNNRIGDTLCGVNLLLSKFNHYGVGLKGSTSIRIIDGALKGRADNDFNVGVVEVLDGPDAGKRRPVSSFNGDRGMVILRVPFDNPLVGRSYHLTRLCHYTLQDCNETFKNSRRYRGFPEVPGRPVLR